jgi:hypothetical protein
MPHKIKTATTRPGNRSAEAKQTTGPVASDAARDSARESGGLPASRILLLQQAVGNKAVQRLVRARPALRLALGRVVQADGDTPQTPLQQLREELDDVFVDEAACLGYIRQLGPAVSTVRNDKTMMSQMAGAFDEDEILQAVQLLSMELKWAIYWINQSGEEDAIGSKGYDTLISGSTAQAIAELIGWSEMTDVVKTNYKGNPLTMFPPLNANNAMLAHVLGSYGSYVDWILDASGGQQLLRFLVSHDPGQMIAALDKSARWDPFLGKLPKGMGLMPVDKTALLTLFDASKNINQQVQLFEVRFGVQATGPKGIAWEPKGLRRAWEMLTVLPPSDVEGNPNLDYIYRAGTGSTAGESNLSTYVKYWYNSDKLGQKDVGIYTDPSDPMSRMNIFDLTIIHEVGHAVDGSTGKFSKAYCPTEPGGGWKWLTPETAVDGMILNKYWTFINWDKVSNARPAMSPEDKMAELNYRVGQLPNARQAAISAATNHTAVQDEANALDATGKLWRLMRTEAVTKAIEPACSEQSPWMRHDKQVRFGDRYFHEGYPGEWSSYLSARYDAKLSKYQFRDPMDWFAEVYALYYGTVDPANPRSEDAGTKVPEPIKTWFRDNVARTTPPPATGGAAP